MRNITIIGGGVSGTVTAIQLIQSFLRAGKIASITIIDAHDSIGPGSPYHSHQSLCLRINDSAYGVSINPDDPFEFLKWLYANPELRKANNISVTKIGENNFKINDPYPPRVLFGQYVEAKFKMACQEAAAKNIRVYTYPKTNALEMSGSNNPCSQWNITCSNDAKGIFKIESDNVVLATGHLASDQFTQYIGPTYYHSPFMDLSHIDRQQTVAIIGTRLTGIDAVKLLDAQGHVGKIYLVSPSGLLPNVKNLPQPAEAYQLKYLTPEKLQTLLSLKEIIALFNQELAHALDRKSFDIEKYLNHSKPKPTELLKAQIDAVKQNAFNRWNLMLDEIYFHILPRLSECLSKNDYQLFLKKYYPAYIRHTAEMSLPNAEFLLEKINSGQLFIIPMSNINRHNHGFLIKTNSKEITCDIIINATGSGRDISLDPLLNHLHQKGLLTKHAFGGIAIDPKTHAVLDKDGNPRFNLYALGPCVIGNNIGTFSVIVCSQDARIVVNEILKPSLQTSLESPLFDFWSKKPSPWVTNPNINTHSKEFVAKCRL